MEISEEKVRIEHFDNLKKKHNLVNCAFCKKEFLNVTKRAIYCSNQCMNKAYELRFKKLHGMARSVYRAKIDPYFRNWMNEHKERMRELTKIWIAEHPERYKLLNNRWRVKNKDKIREYWTKANAKRREKQRLKKESELKTGK